VNKQLHACMQVLLFSYPTADVA